MKAVLWLTLAVVLATAGLSAAENTIHLAAPAPAPRSDAKNPTTTEYDYIVVGAGASGAAVAARLSEDARVTVLLIEAGPDFRSSDSPKYMQCPNPIMGTDLPSMAMYGYENMTATHTKAQPAGPWIRGKGTGGCTIINGQIAIRGRPEDYDGWESKYGAKGWNWKTVLPYFKKSEMDLTFGDKPYHGTKGPIPIYRAPRERWGAIDAAHVTAALGLGIAEWNDDNNSENPSGVSTSAVTSIYDRRVSSNDGYLEQARDRANFRILGDTVVDKITFAGTKATGVSAVPAAKGPAGTLRGSGALVFTARREVILSAGVIQNPGILLRSGIGAKADLAALGVAPRLVNEHVGKHLAEHPITNIFFDLTPEASPPSIEFRTTNIATRFSSGLLAPQDGGIDDVGFLSMNVANDPTLPGPTMGVISAILWKPFSKGSVAFKTTNPLDLPEITLNLLDEKSDLERMRFVTRKLQAMAVHPAFAALSKDTYTFDPKGNKIMIDDFAKFTDDQLDQWIMENAVDGEHASCTCAMMKVVDEDLRVYGFQNLRIADTSVYPSVPRSNTMLSAYMMGEKAADIIKAAAAAPTVV